MNIDWLGAMDVRHSVRKYKAEAAHKDKMTQLTNFAASLKPPFMHDIEIRFFQSEQNKRLYSIFVSPPDGIALIGDTDEISISKAGFLGELMILYATSLGLATCWFGHYKIAELERVMPHLPSMDCILQSNMGYGYAKGSGNIGRRAICITPLGYKSEEGIQLLQRVQGLIGARRKPISALIEGSTDVAALPDVIQQAMEYAAKAPSAMNSQHWRFHVSEDKKTVTIAMPLGYRHIKWEHPNVDIGICAAHFWLMLQEMGVENEVTISEEQGRVLWRFEVSCGIEK